MTPPIVLSAQLFVSLVTLLVVLHVLLGATAYAIWLERRLSGWIQDRLGPNRVGPFGLLQPLADGVKMLTKEDYRPALADSKLFTLAPMAILVPALMGWAIIPWAGWVEIKAPFTILGLVQVEPGRALVAAVDVGVGVVYALAVASLGVYGVVLGGWASNNKYSFLGGLRATSSMVSYEIPLGVSLLTILLIVGSVHPQKLVEWQAENSWFVLAQPVAAVVFFVCLLAEANRAPFDIAEAESELVGGYHTEYSAMRMGAFFLGEYAHVVAGSALFSALFLGGPHLPGVASLGPAATGGGAVLAKFVVMSLKTFLMVCFVMLCRWTLPRLRWDQIMRLAWNGLIPLSVVVLVATSALVYLGWTAWWQQLLMSLLAGGAVVALQPVLPWSDANRKAELVGSRFAAPPDHPWRPEAPAPSRERGPAQASTPSPARAPEQLAATAS
ncbi:MAG: NADH-quinone oxidoreductase subunit NuoH [Planctomycetota bacterium]|nr:MAG: NADH-quinone oxidoreductase subunit NuoH [Planctomycetota bacterium]